MVRTGARAAVLADLLEQGGLRLAPAPPRLQLSALPAAIASDVLGVYAALGGVLAAPKLRPGAWDLAFEDGLIVELDEELHFNRYRLLTLNAPWYGDRAWAPEYRELCVQREQECLAAGKWENGGSTPPASRCSDPAVRRVNWTAQVPRGGSSARSTTR